MDSRASIGIIDAAWSRVTRLVRSAPALHERSKPPAPLLIAQLGATTTLTRNTAFAESANVTTGARTTESIAASANEATSRPRVGKAWGIGGKGIVIPWAIVLQAHSGNCE